MKRFVKDNGLRGMQFILLWRGLGPVGYGQLVVGRRAAALAVDRLTGLDKGTSKSIGPRLPGHGLPDGGGEIA